MFEQITDEIMGLGPLEPLLHDALDHGSHGQRPAPNDLRRELELTNVHLPERRHAHHRPNATAPIGRRVDESSPMVDARLTDGSRVNTIVQGVYWSARSSPFRKFSAPHPTVDDLIRFGTATADMLDFLRACVEAR